MRLLKSLFRIALLVGISTTSRNAAADFIVNNNLDSGPGSLRQAVSDANAAGGNITFSGVTGTIVLTNGQLTISQTNVNLIGPGTTNLTISGYPLASNRVFLVASNASGTISGLTIANGTSIGPGGGILNNGNLILNDCVVANSSTTTTTSYSGVTNVFGGGIYNSGTLALTNCVISRNTVTNLSDIAGSYPHVVGMGGGIYNQGTLALYQTLVTSNYCTTNVTLIESDPPNGGDGGGIYNANTATIILSTVANNASGSGPFGDGTGAGGRGGGIFNIGNLTIIASIINSNSTGAGGGTSFDGGYPGAPGGNGAGIWNSGQLIVMGTSLQANVCGNGGISYPYASTGYVGGSGGNGGGIFNSGICAITNSSFLFNLTGNGATGGFDNTSVSSSAPWGGVGGSGGAAANFGTLSLVNCTLFGNGTGRGGAGTQSYNPSHPGGTGGNGGPGGAIWNQSSNLAMVGCTISSNATGPGGAAGAGYTNSFGTNYTLPGLPGTNGPGGGIYGSSGTAQLINTIIANDTAVGGPDVFGTFTSQGHNLIKNTNGSSGFDVTNDVIGVDPLLAQLGNYGGATMTCTLLSGSPAIDAGDDSVTNTITTDQRGFPRLARAHVDIGAVEDQMATQPVSITTWSANGGGLGGTFVLGFTNTPGASLTVFGSTNLTAPINTWARLGAATELPPGSGHFVFAAPQAANLPGQFYRVTSP